MCEADVTPYWTCVYDELSRQDPIPLPLQRLFLCLVAIAYLPIMFPLTVGHFVGLDDSYFEFDKEHTFNFLTLMSVTTGLSPLQLYVCVSLTAAFFATLVWADITAIERPFRWPKVWETENNACYDDMFCEPSRKDRLIRRPGNTLSNFFYLFSAMIVLTSSYSRAFISEEKTSFILSDATFGTMMLILSISSTVWHGCNAMWSHGVDLWSMDAVIIYLPIRMMSLGVFVTLCKHSWDPIMASHIASAACMLIYAAHILSNGSRWKKKHDQKFWHKHFPFAVRNRLLHSPYVQTKKDDTINSLSLGPIPLYEVYLFALMPVIHNIPSWIMAKKVYESFGSVCFARILNISLAVGWAYRMTERWALDACRHIKFFGERMEMAKKNGEHIKSFSWMTLAAVLSPTAVLHYCTGITLTAAFCHARSVEIIMLQKFLVL
ncbi:hypothetical protein QTG54_005902 [Skeletonema marinoi]|uniref:Uncharacterized protein n=1 Tax=Skeletonema marinoi TaxID=267567 RepID=A0AAD8YDK6_9STRA|nr:hypothetical protein QTG54_005902 [Skeletonema marinoi]